MASLLDILGRIGFDWRMALFSLINFLAVFFLLKKLFFKTILNTLDERQKVIQDGIDNAKKAETEVKMAETRAQALIDEAKVEANKVIERAQEESVAQAEKMKDRAKQEIEMLVAQAKKNIEIDKKDMQDTLRKETVELVVLVVEKILSEKLSGEKDTQFVKDILGTLK